MHDLLTGIFFWTALGICLVGVIVRFVSYFKGLDWKLDRVAYTVYPAAGLKGALVSIYRWLIPFGTHGWRTQPVITLLFFGFHIGAVLVPIFLLGHNVFLRDKLGFSFFTLNPFAADVLTWTALICALFLIARRLLLPHVRIMTTMYDYTLLLISVAPFATGLLARYHTGGDYSFWLNMHIFYGELLLIAIPFTRLSHIFLFFASRAQLGMDFGIKRGGRKGTNMAW